MIHYGDITKISGACVPPVDAVIGGSPCQDLSVAGKQIGLAGGRSGLFFEQVRIIKEMREKTDGKYPRFMVWENVPGVFSSNKGQDFRAALEETIRIAEPDAPDIPLPSKGKWPMADCWYGDGWSIAYRVFDSQFWGVPQRRRRIALVADFGGHAAPEILFIRKSVCGDFGESETPGKEAAAGTGGGTDPTVYCIQGNCIDRADTAGCNGKGWTTDVSYTLNTIDRPAVALYENHGQDSRLAGPLETAPTVSQKFGTGGNNTPLVMHPAFAIGNGQVHDLSLGEKARTLNCMHDAQALIVPTGESDCPYIVRRITPLECERLQGFPDGWTDIGTYIDTKGKKREASDTARYKALGNSIAIPPWTWVLKRLSGCFEKHPTMASLFDGIGGFPLIWERINGKGSCLWASEIDEFAIAVTKRRFAEESEE